MLKKTQIKLPCLGDCEGTHYQSIIRLETEMHRLILTDQLITPISSPVSYLIMIIWPAFKPAVTRAHHMEAI